MTFTRLYRTNMGNAVQNIEQLNIIMIYPKKVTLNSMNPGDTIKLFRKTTYLTMNTDLAAYLPLLSPYYTVSQKNVPLCNWPYL